MMKRKIAIVAMSAKPMHAGHMQLINIASRENDVVKLFVSLDDRKRRGEVPIYGDDMEHIWKTYIAKSLPKNVELTYTKNISPIRHVYSFLGNIDNDLEDEYVIYSDPSDIQNSFSNAQLQKYLGNLQSKGKIHLEPIQRSQTTDISGTQMRNLLKTGDKDLFISNLPDILQDVGEDIWNTLQVSLAIRGV